MAQDNIARVLALQAKKAAEEGSLPTVTDADNGKDLSVVNGAWAPVMKAPLVVHYTITGLPDNGVYPLSADYTLAQMLAAKAAGREVKASIQPGTDALELPLISRSSGSVYDFVAFSNVTYYNGTWVIFQIATGNNGNVDTSTGEIIPINTTVMSYNTTSDTLSITNVPEVS